LLRIAFSSKRDKRWDSPVPHLSAGSMNGVPTHCPKESESATHLKGHPTWGNHGEKPQKNNGVAQKSNGDAMVGTLFVRRGSGTKTGSRTASGNIRRSTKRHGTHRKCAVADLCVEPRHFLLKRRLDYDRLRLLSVNVKAPVRNVWVAVVFVNRGPDVFIDGVIQGRHMNVGLMASVEVKASSHTRMDKVGRCRCPDRYKLRVNFRGGIKVEPHHIHNLDLDACCESELNVTLYIVVGLRDWVHTDRGFVAMMFPTLALMVLDRVFAEVDRKVCADVGMTICMNRPQSRVRLAWRS